MTEDARDADQAWEDYRLRQESESRPEFVEYEERIVPKEIIDKFRRLLVKRVKIPARQVGNSGPKTTG